MNNFNLLKESDNRCNYKLHIISSGVTKPAQQVILDPVQGLPRRSAQKSVLKTQEPIMSVFPNPARDYFTIQYRTEGQNINNLQLIIQDAQGRKIMEKQLNEFNNDELIDIRTLVSGIYSVILYGNNNVLSAEKLVVVK